jgi:hypothetical protein
MGSPGAVDAGADHASDRAPHRGALPPRLGVGGAAPSAGLDGPAAQAPGCRARPGGHGPVGQGALAADSANAQRRRACLVFFDESALSLTPNVRRSWAPRGRPPVLVHPVAAGRVATGRARAGQVLAGQPPRDHLPAAAGGSGQTALASRARLSRAERRARPGSRRGPLLAGLASPRHPGLGRACLRHLGAAGPKSGCVGLTTFAVLRELQLLVAGWAGACPLCRRRFPRSTPWLHPPPAPT